MSYHDQDLRKPILPGTAATDYERYLRTDELFALQKSVGQMSHPDELTFQVVHQSSELLMKAAIADMERARVWIYEGKLGQAARLMRRANEMFQTPIALLHILEQITPKDYHVIRAGLGHGSGLDSPGFLGLLHITKPIWETFESFLQKLKITVLDIYRDPGKNFELHQVAEEMLDFDERLQLFRLHHLKLAERIIGPGVIGTSGVPVEILKQRMDHVFFKPLWEVRNQITADANAALAEKSQGHGRE
jgi:tryptophan 2,3-dioxygenase